MSKISVKGVDKVFRKGEREVVALKDVTFDINEGESFGILGPSGAGKTTLLRIMAGLDVPTKGEVYFGDKIAAKDGKLLLEPKDRDIGFVFQTWALYPNMNGYANIAFPLKNMNLDNQEIDKRVKDISNTLGITQVLDHYPREMSGGQMQRVALARALVKMPSTLFLDEPFTNLDARIRDGARALVKDITKKFNITTIIVSHDPADIFGVAERVGVLDRGYMVQIGSPTQVYDSPVSVTVANLIGEINELRVVVSSDGKALTIGKLSLNIPSGLSGAEFVIGIRPEDVIASKEPSHISGFELLDKARFSILSYQGGHFRLTLQLESDNQEIFTYVDQPVKGDEYYVYVRKEKIKLFST
ncbi:glucose ABC transporter ATP-binding protein GlcV [Tardisphaera miroshnichenkoae]